MAVLNTKIPHSAFKNNCIKCLVEMCS
uniref:Uncharacterized protein n=1 Tax=Anguilla anguilla TaxID=7936 RepID=A0A0E9V3A9_ANGAN